jgi:hypothetical protein
MISFRHLWHLYQLQLLSLRALLLAPLAALAPLLALLESLLREHLLLIAGLPPTIRRATLEMFRVWVALRVRWLVNRMEYAIMWLDLEHLPGVFAARKDINAMLCQRIMS